MNTEIITAMRTDIGILFHLIYKYSGLAGIAFLQHTIRHFWFQFFICTCPVPFRMLSTVASQKPFH